VEFDMMVRRVGALPKVQVPGYTAVDARVGWRVTQPLEVSLTVQNLFDPGHIEWGPAGSPVEHPRGVYVRAIWRQ
jgi:iron complex outermembrane receptor protein